MPIDLTPKLVDLKTQKYVWHLKNGTTNHYADYRSVFYSHALQQTFDTNMTHDFRCVSLDF